MYILTNTCTTDLNMDGTNLAPGQGMQVQVITAQHRALIEANVLAAESVPEVRKAKVQEPKESKASTAASESRSKPD